MANERKTVIRGISEVGAVRAATDVSFGRTTPNGVTLAFSGSDLEVESGQSTMLEAIFNQSDRIAVTFRLIFADLVNFREALGLPDAALTGDLNPVDPAPAVEEVLAITEANLRSREDALYAITPGPASTRRYDFHRCRVRAGLSIEMSRDGHVILEFTAEVLRPEAGNVITITDAV